MTLLMLVNPFEGMPVFLSATDSVEPELRKKILRITVFAVTIILMLSLIFGRAILQLFGITSGVFQIGGGTILFLIAIRMTLGPEGSLVGSLSGAALKPSFGIVPLAMPLFAGPGAINGAILFGTRAHTLEEMTILLLIVVLIGIVLFATLKMANRLARYLGTTGIDVATRVTGLLISAIAAEMIVKGISSVFNLNLM